MKFDTLILTSLILVIAVGAGAVALKRINKTGARSIVVMAFSLLLWSLIYLGMDTNFLLAANEPAAILVYVCRLCAVSSLLAFALSYRQRPGRLSDALILLGIIPVITHAVWIGSQQTFRFAPSIVQFRSSLSTGEIEETISAIYVCALSVIGAFLLWETFVRVPRFYRQRMWVIPIAAILPYLVQTLDLLGVYSGLPIEPLLPAFALTVAGFAYSLTLDDLGVTVSISRQDIVDAMVDGLIVLDRRNIILDVNSALERIIGQSRDMTVGKSVESVLGTLPNLNRAITETFEFERKKYLGSPEEWQYLNIRVSPLMDRDNEAVGRIIIWRDSTKRRQAEDARQKAREEMFVLINTISSEAREATGLQEFLSETTYQIVYPFHSQVVLIYLVDESEHDEKVTRYYLASHFGIPNNAMNEILDISSYSSMFGQALIDRQPVLIEDAARDLRVPPMLQQLGVACFLVVPLITKVDEENRVQGCLCLGRKDKPVYSRDEIARIMAVCDHIASLIDNDRRRKLAIALSERQRLLRDLHDSVSQKLYGLVTLTEAAQAALETGNLVDPSQVLTRIGDNARQAVREMRLFLYQMQPVDLEKDGLLSALHHRLASVEGRADIKARLLADENIELSNEKEISLFFIAQEALNNILRHARAKTVTVKLKQGRRNVILEIVDDGCGFDPKKLDRAGLGLENMKERTKIVNGKIKISSAPGKGTKIVVSVESDHILAPRKR